MGRPPGSNVHKKYWMALAIVASVAVGVGIVVGLKNKESAGGHPRSVLVPLAIQHNGEDIKFARAMIPHHQEVLEMALLADTRAGQQGVRRLATELIELHSREMAEMRQWLSEWGESSDAPAGAEVAPMANLVGLKAASGDEFDRAFLSMMTEHHQRALALAEVEKSGGRYAPAKELANQIIAARRAEIEQMQSQLKGS